MKMGAPRKRIRLTPENLLTEVEARTTPEPNTGCWLWSLAADLNGYAVVIWNGKTTRLVRILLGIVGQAGIVARHSCDTPACCNPLHLLPGTREQNTADMMSRGRCRATGRKLSPTQAAEILTRARGGERAVELAAEFGLTRYTVIRIRERRTWAHLPEARP